MPCAAQVKQKEYEVLCVSQFTLYGRLQKTKPDFSKAMLAQQVRPIDWNQALLLPPGDVSPGCMAVHTDERGVGIP